MANTKISALNSLTKATLATNDVFPVVDTGSTETKKITYQELIQPTDANFRIAGSADNTKLVAFEVDGLTTATTRTITIPDANTTLVGTDTTQTLTNKTLTAPQINMGSDATGDTYYRTAGGAFARLPIGTSGQILQSSSGGIPEWIANPSVTTATTSAAGIVELATTAETETGTDATRAVTPDSLHDMTTLAGAAWFLDEDTMSSDSATKTASQQSIKAYADTKSSLASVINTSETYATYFTYTTPLLYFTESGPAYVVSGWTKTGTVTDPGVYNGGAGISVVQWSTAGTLTSSIPGTTSNLSYTAAASKDIRIKYRAKYTAAIGGGRYGSVGIADASSTLDNIQTDTTASIRFVLDNTTLYAVSANGTTNNNTDVSSSLTYTNWNTFEIVFNPGTDVKFYINGSIVATHSSNLPTGSLQLFGFGTAASCTLGYFSPITFNIEQ